MPNESPNKSLLQTILTMIDSMAHEGNGYDTLINILSLLCLLSILNRLQPPAVLSNLAANPQSTQAAPATNPLQKILGDLTKNMDGGSGSGPSPDMLMSLLPTLLPLLNNPQIKSKLNPANMSNILGLMNNLGGSNNNDKPETKKTEKPEKIEKTEISPAAAVTPSLAEHPPATTTNDATTPDKKDLGRSLNWKTNFQNEKEV